MTALGYLIPISLSLGLVGLAAFLWSLRSGQFRDMDGDGARILLEEDPEPFVSGRARPVPVAVTPRTAPALKLVKRDGCTGTCATCRCEADL